MPTKVEMHNLGQGIIASFEARTASVAALRQEVKEQLGDLDRNRHTMARQLRAYLARGPVALTAEVNTSLKEMDRSHQAMARQLRADLSRGRVALTAEVNTSLKEMDRSHHAMASQLRADLAQGRATLSKQDGQLRANSARGRANLRTSVSAQLREMDQTHNAMSRRLRSDLAHGRADLQQQVREQRSDLKRGCAGLSRAETQRKAEVHAQMGHVAAEHAGARQEWHKLAVTMGSKRNGVAVTEELAALSDRVFQYLANHPDGARLTEIEREFDLGRLQAGRLVRHLMDEGKAEKRDLNYFAT